MKRGTKNLFYHSIVFSGIAFFSFFFSGCELPSEVNPHFSTRNEVLIFNADGVLIRRSVGLRGVPRDIVMLEDGNAVVAVDGRGLTILDPRTGNISNYFGPEFLQDVDVVKGKTILGLRPTYLTVWYNDDVARLLDDAGNEIGALPIPKGCNDVNLLPNGNILLTESIQNRIREIRQDGSQVWISAVPLRNPFEAILTPRDTIIIADFDHHRLLEVDRQNNILMKMEGFNHPRHIQLLEDNNILVADSDMRRVVVVIPPEKQYVLTANLNRPTCVAFSPENQLLLIGIEPFFPLTPNDIVSSSSTARLKSVLIWLGGSIVLALLFLLVSRWGQNTLLLFKTVFQCLNRLNRRYCQLIFAVGMLLCMVGSWWFANGTIRWGWYAVIGGVFFLILSRLSRDTWFDHPPKEENEILETNEEEWNETIIRSPLLLYFGLILSWFVFIWSRSWSMDQWPVVLWILAPCLALFGFHKRSREMMAPVDIVWLTLIFAAAAFFRLYRIYELPCGLWLDETYAIWKALLGSETHGIAPFQTQPLVRANEFEIANMYLLILVWLSKTIGASFMMVKWLSLLPAFGIVLGVYCLGKWTFGPWAARFGALMIAMNSWQVTFARWGWLQQLYVMLAVLALAFYIRSYKWKCPRSAALAGLCLGYGFYTYVPIVLTTATIVGLFIVSFFEKDRLIHFKQLCIGAVMLTIVFAPLWGHFVENPGTFMTRANKVGVFSQLKQAQSLDPLKENFHRYATAFHRPGENNPRHNIANKPILDPLTGGLFLAGLGLCLLRCFRPNERALLSAFGVAMIGGILSSAIEAPNSFRLGLAGPVLCLMAALPLASLSDLREKFIENGKNQWWIVILLVMIFSSIGTWNYVRYFKQYPTKETWDGSMGARQHLIYSHLTPETIGRERLFVYAPITTTTFTMYTYFLEVENVGAKHAKVVNQRYTILDVKTRTPALAPGWNTFVMPPDYEHLLREKFPNATVTILKNPYDEPIAVMGKVYAP
ncbi:MAG: hypothetical protein C4527_18270 [Candidatus Omnitrophota bacterium]|jgi:4-amino-4-deoxy-L-arabinose transferase-like glycosyltransferase|nr:MAG: hypothetical protein C4527_18270 [Candidatus Omnitrophota bacterium]